MTDKRALWTRLKAEQPQLATFLADFARRFGKPAAVRVIHLATQETLLQTGMDARSPHHAARAAGERAA